MATILSPHAADLTGQTFGRWHVLSYAGMALNGRTTWNCRCECGKEHVVNSKLLFNHQSQSCGCLRRDLAIARAKERRQAQELPVYQNGTPAFQLGSPLDQPSLRHRLAELARKLRPGDDPLTATLRPGHSRTDGLARACAILALGREKLTEPLLIGCAFALDKAGLKALAAEMDRVIRGLAEGYRDEERLNGVRRDLLEVQL